MSFEQIQVELQDYMGSDRTIAESAWTSSTKKEHKDLRSDDDVVRIVNMLADSGHAVPFESVIFRFWYRMPISTDRQHMTHRMASHNGMSGRYRTMPSDYQVMPEDVFRILEKCLDPHIIKYANHTWDSNATYVKQLKFIKEQRDAGIISTEEYKRAREFLRGMLPQNNMTERTTTINLRSLANYIRCRYSTHAQKEICFVAERMLEELRDKCYNLRTALGALERNEWDITPKYSPPRKERWFADISSYAELRENSKPA